MHISTRKDTCPLRFSDVEPDGHFFYRAAASSPDAAFKSGPDLRKFFIQSVEEELRGNGRLRFLNF